eukprot:3600759-Rhodomonas_salina.1
MGIGAKRKGNRDLFPQTRGRSLERCPNELAEGLGMVLLVRARPFSGPDSAHRLASRDYTLLLSHHHPHGHEYQSVWSLGLRGAALNNIAACQPTHAWVSFEEGDTRVIEAGPG